jgi:hypothetical protein
MTKALLTALLLFPAIQVRAPLEPAVGGFVHGDDVLGDVWPLLSEYSLGLRVHWAPLGAAVWRPGSVGICWQMLA